jgi:ATP-dependent DNA helicase RecQ
MNNLEKILQDSFGLEKFREWQREVCESIISGQDTLVFMPTWGWKSLTYQLPGMVMDWLTIVISPLISLMKDQVDALQELWIKAKLINSTVDSWEISEIFTQLEEGGSNSIKFLYIAPERLNSFRFLSIIKKVKISLVAIDEAHCISQWGHDFRPSYMKILGFLDDLKKDVHFPIIALTATATQKVREDITERLWIGWANTFTKWFDRKNITIVVREISEKQKKFEKVLEILDKTKWSWIIYCSSRKSVDEVYAILQEYHVKSWKYTWAMTPEVRETMQNKFMNDEYKVIVATNAFWMGIDKKDIRFIIHFNLPGSIENYYQEVGRAWRDGKNSFAVALASYWDTKIQEFFIDNTYPEKQEVLDLYDYLYKWFKIWEWKNHSISMTQHQLATHSGVSSDMKVWNILKILEKYQVISKGMNDSEKDEWFRGRWVTLVQEKRNHSHLLIDWKRQDALKTEAYFKLEQIKRLLFYPSCRKKFILDYFGDEEDLKTLWDNCGACDFCLDKKKFADSDMKEIIPVSAFALILETVKKYDERFGQVMIRRTLEWSEEKKILQNKLNCWEHYGALKDYSKDTVWAMMDALRFEGYIYKTNGQYPMLGISELGSAVIVRNKALKEALEELNTYVVGKVWLNLHKKSSSKNSTSKTSKANGETYKETLDLFKSWKSMSEISTIRDLKPITIESHIVKMYESGEISLMDVLKLITLADIKKVKEVINEKLWWNIEPLRPIKDELDNIWEKKISYFDIKVAIAMMGKGDI